MMHINSVTPHDRTQLLAIAARTKLFTPEEADALLGDVLDSLWASTLPDGHQAVCCRLQPDEPPIGWCYFAPDDHAADVWNLWWIGVDPGQHGSQAGKALLTYAEDYAVIAGGRILIIETSDAEPLMRARRFYARSSYQECGRIPHFYAENEAKVIYSRRLPTTN